MRHKGASAAFRQQPTRRHEGAKQYEQAKRKIRLAPLLVAAGIGLAATSAAVAAPLAPVITSPTYDAHVNTTAVQVNGTVSGDAVLVRVFDGATAVGDTGPSGGYFSVGVGLADGPHTLRARARDGSGIWGPLSDPIPIVVDTVNPAAPVITAPADGQVVGFSAVTVEGTAEPGAAIRIEASTGAVLHATADPGGDWSVARSFSDASHTLTAVATDAATNQSLPSAAVTFRVDTIAPGAPIIFTPGDGAFRNATSVGITGSAEPGSTVKVFRGATILMTVPATDGTWSGTATFAEGAHTITARTTDVAGNASASSPPTTFTVDLTAPPAPVITSPRDGDFVKGDYVVTGRSEPFARVELMRTNFVIGHAIADASGTWSVAQSRFSGPQVVKARAIDRAGNIGPFSPLVSFTVDATPPARPEVITKNGRIFLPTETPRLEGRASDDIGVLAVSLEYYDLAGKAHRIFNANCQGCPGPSVDWNTTYAPLPGRYVIKAYTVDRAGNRSLPTEFVIWRL